MTTKSEALQLVRRLVKGSPDDSVSRAAAKVERLLTATPMTVILNQVRPGEPIWVKIKALGVARQTYYYWMNGTTRPSRKLAQKIARMTDFTVDEIRGYAD